MARKDDPIEAVIRRLFGGGDQRRLTLDWRGRGVSRNVDDRRRLAPGAVRVEPFVQADAANQVNPFVDTLPVLPPMQAQPPRGGRSVRYEDEIGEAVRGRSRRRR